MSKANIYRRLIAYTCNFIADKAANVDNTTRLDHIYRVLLVIADSLGMEGRWVLERRLYNDTVQGHDAQSKVL